MATLLVPQKQLVPPPSRKSKNGKHDSLSSKPHLVLLPKQHTLNASCEARRSPSWGRRTGNAPRPWRRPRWATDLAAAGPRLFPRAELVDAPCGGGGGGMGPVGKPENSGGGKNPNESDIAFDSGGKGEKGVKCQVGKDLASRFSGWQQIPGEPNSEICLEWPANGSLNPQSAGN